MHDRVSGHSLTPFIHLLRSDPDLLLFQALYGVVVLSIVWPLAFLGYLVTQYGIRILAWQ
jgi:hypothetical protein